MTLDSVLSGRTRISPGLRTSPATRTRTVSGANVARANTRRSSSVTVESSNLHDFQIVPAKRALSHKEESTVA